MLQSDPPLDTYISARMTLNSWNSTNHTQIWQSS